MSPREIQSLVYDPSGDTLHIWLIEGTAPPTMNRHVQDGFYEVVTLDDRRDVVGYEIVGFRHYASVHTEASPLLRAFDQLPGETLTLIRPSPRAGLEILLHA